MAEQTISAGQVIDLKSFDKQKLKKDPAAPQGNRRLLVGSGIDALMIGGGSILVYLLVKVTVAPVQPVTAITWAVFYLSFAMNFPHFLVSYQLLYIDCRKMIFSNFRFFWAAVLSPLILGGLLVAAIASGSSSFLGYFANAMYFFVGWHYVKQTFGGVVVTNAIQKVYYNKIERYALQGNLYALWGLSWVSQNMTGAHYQYEGVSYNVLHLPVALLNFCYVAVALSFGAVVLTHFQKWIREGKRPTLSAVICYATIYVWFIPALYHPLFFLLIPFFHSAQYLLFVYALRRNKAEKTIGAPTSPEARKKYVTQFWGYLALPFVTGAIGFWYLPRFLDSLHLANSMIFGPTLAMFAFTIFFNIHHYFIDNVIWKGTNPEVKNYLFAS